MAKASNNEFPSVLFDEQASDVSTPGTGLWRAYFKSDGLYAIDDAGVVTGPFVDSGGVAAFSGARVRRTSSLALTNNTLTTVAFDAEDFDTDSYHDTGSNTERLTAPETGYYEIRGALEVAADADMQKLSLGIRQDGTTYLTFKQVTTPGGLAMAEETATIAHLEANEYVELLARTNTSDGGAGSVSAGGGLTGPRFEIVKLS